MKTKNLMRPSAVHAIIRNNNKILLVNAEGYWMLPGGSKLSEKETNEKCLEREVKEELNGTEILFSYNNFYKKIYSRSNRPIISKVYEVFLRSKIKGVSNEVTEYVWLEPVEALTLPSLSRVTKTTLISLLNNNYFKSHP